MPVWIGLVCDDKPGIFHQLSQVRSLSSWRGAHIEEIRSGSGAKGYTGQAGSEGLRVNITEEVLKQFPRPFQIRCQEQGIIPVADPLEMNPLFLERLHQALRFNLQPIDP